MYRRSIPLTASKVAAAITPASRFAAAGATFAVAKVLSMVWFHSIAMFGWTLPAANPGGAIAAANATVTTKAAIPVFVFMALTYTSV